MKTKVLAGGPWPGRAREAAPALSAAGTRAQNRIGALPMGIRHVFAQAQAQFHSTRDLIGGLSV